jgi:ATP-dependent DNA helicase RecQ
MNKPVPFRKWYGNLGQLREILSNVRFMVCTATASLSTKSKIFSVLSITSDETLIVEMSPERKNLRYVVQYVDNAIPMSELFRDIIMEVRKGKDKTTKTLLYCQTRNQCAILWRMFKLELGIDIYLNGCPTPTGYLVQMFHAGTPESAKKMILESVSSYENHIRVVICTIAFGMGINCRGVERVIHFGPSANVLPSRMWKSRA